VARFIALTPGDPAGIGPEITWKAIRSGIEAKFGIRLLCIGARKPFEKMGVPLDLVDASELTRPGFRKRLTDRRKTVLLLSAPESAEVPGVPHLEGFQSGWAIQEAVRLTQAGVTRAIVTGPISKERFQAGGFPFPGHTEFLAHLCRKGRKTPKVVMMLANEQLRVALVTTHLSLAEVPPTLTRRALEETIAITADHLRRWWGIRRPKIAVLALNPHAGESGIFGTEEQRIISPVLKKLCASATQTMVLSGPHPADTFFAKHIALSRKDRSDAVVCMYHDQGLIPVKLLDFAGSVNITLGLPIIRTSVDHGVGFDIAGKGLADPSSMLAAIRLAARLSS